MRFAPIVPILMACVAFAQKPRPADSAFLGAVSQLEEGHYADAEAAFRRLTETEPDRVRGFSGVAQVFMAQRQPREAIAYLQSEVQKRPDRVDIQVLLGDTSVRAGDYDLALNLLQGALKRLDQNAAAELEVPRGAAGGSLYHEATSDPLSDSIRVLTVRDLTPKGAAGLHVRLAELFRLRREHASGIAEWELCAGMLPKTHWILANLGLAQELGGKGAEAMKSYRESLAAFPDTPLVLNNLAFLMAEYGGDLFEAMRFARRAESLAPGSLDILDTQGWIALKQGFLDDAAGTFQRVVEKQPGNADFRKHLGLALAKRDVHSPAIDELLKALNSPVVPGDDDKILALLQSAAKKRP